jgi:basic membrane lipoprotein Med (substrate-binding protein (PBP1-ABC) superfamily)
MGRECYQSGAARLVRAALFFALCGCQLVVDDHPGAGIGASCSKDEQCQASKCVEGICTIPCSAPADCPSPTFCAGGSCQLPMRVGFIQSAADVEQNQWAKAHEDGRTSAQPGLPYVVAMEVVTGKNTAGEAVAAVDGLVGGGADVVVTVEPTYGEELQEKAGQYPDVAFLTCGSRVQQNNHGSYYGRAYQAYYLAGFAAGKQSDAGRVGIVGSYVTPDVVAAINAFALGAKRASSDVMVEVGWVGFWHDQNPPDAQGKSREVVLADQMKLHGADVIADTTDANVVVSYLKSGTGAQSIGYSTFGACKDNPTCIGAVTWNWGPLYQYMLDDIHQAGIPYGAHYVDNIRQDPQQSVVNFELNAPEGAPESLQTDINAVLQELVSGDGERRPFRGPLCSTGQREECIGDGVTITEEELRNMCWFVEGLVENDDPVDPAMDVPAEVPQEGDCAPAM